MMIPGAPPVRTLSLAPIRCTPFTVSDSVFPTAVSSSCAPAGSAPVGVRAADLRPAAVLPTEQHQLGAPRVPEVKAHVPGQPVVLFACGLPGRDSTCEHSFESSTVGPACTISLRRRAITECRNPAQTVRQQPLARRFVRFPCRRQRIRLSRRAPLPDAATGLMEQLQGSRAVVYLRWPRQGDEKAPPSIVDDFVPAAPWTLASTIKNVESGRTLVEVYALSGS